MPEKSRFTNRVRRHHCALIAHHLPRFLAPAIVAASGIGASVFASAIPSASAGPCPDVQVVFTRGTDERRRVSVSRRRLCQLIPDEAGTGSSDGHSVALHDSGGEGPPLLFAHATGMHGWTWSVIAVHRVGQFQC